MRADILIAGSGIAGLLLAAALAPRFSVVVVERRRHVPRNKYWLTDEKSAAKAPSLEACIAARHETLAFIAYDDLATRIRGPYVLWNTDAIVTTLVDRAVTAGAQFLFDHPFCTCSWHADHLKVKAGPAVIQTRLLLDCMGYESPLVAAKRTVDFLGFFILSGRRVALRRPLEAIALHNPLLQDRPTYLEVFPRGDGTANLTMISPARSLKNTASMSRDLDDALRLAPYRQAIDATRLDANDRLFGIVPVGIARQHSLDRVFFFGESGQVNPAASATGLSRMFHTYQAVAQHLANCLDADALRSSDLQPRKLQYVPRMHRLFQEALFRQILDFSSDGFRQLVQDLDRVDDRIVNGLLFADLDIRREAWPLVKALTASTGLFSGAMLRAWFRYPLAYRWFNPRR